MGNIKVKYVPAEYKGIFMWADLARKKLRSVKWIKR